MTVEPVGRGLWIQPDQTTDGDLGSWLSQFYCSSALRRHPPEAIERLGAFQREQVWISATVAAALRFGAAKLASPRFTAAVESWLSGFSVPPWPVEAWAFR